MERENSSLAGDKQDFTQIIKDVISNYRKYAVKKQDVT